MKNSAKQMKEKISAFQTGLLHAQGFSEDASGHLQGSDGGKVDAMLGATDPNSGQSGQQVSGRGRHPRFSLLRNDKLVQLGFGRQSGSSSKGYTQRGHMIQQFHSSYTPRRSGITCPHKNVHVNVHSIFHTKSRHNPNGIH